MWLHQFVYPFICWWTYGLFLPLAIAKNTAVNICVQVLVCTPVFNSWRHIPRSGITGPSDDSMINFWGATKLFSRVAAPCYSPTGTVRGSLFLHITFHLLDSHHPSEYKVVAYCDAPGGVCQALPVCQVLWGRCSCEPDRSCPCCPIASVSRLSPSFIKNSEREASLFLEYFSSVR